MRDGVPNWIDSIRKSNLDKKLAMPVNKSEVVIKIEILNMLKDTIKDHEKTLSFLRSILNL